ncbi:unnamed protein product, partial [Amoebophrya sp. A25]
VTFHDGGAATRSTSSTSIASMGTTSYPSSASLASIGSSGSIASMAPCSSTSAIATCVESSSSSSSCAKKAGTMTDRRHRDDVNRMGFLPMTGDDRASSSSRKTCSLWLDELREIEQIHPCCCIKGDSRKVESLSFDIPETRPLPFQHPLVPSISAHWRSKGKGSSAVQGTGGLDVYHEKTSEKSSSSPTYLRKRRKASYDHEDQEEFFPIREEHTSPSRGNVDQDRTKEREREQGTHIQHEDGTLFRGRGGDQYLGASLASLHDDINLQKNSPQHSFVQSRNALQFSCSISIFCSIKIEDPTGRQKQFHNAAKVTTFLARSLSHAVDTSTMRLCEGLECCLSCGPASKCCDSVAGGEENANDFHSDHTPEQMNVQYPLPASSPGASEAGTMRDSPVPFPGKNGEHFFDDAADDGSVREWQSSGSLCDDALAVFEHMCCPSTRDWQYHTLQRKPFAGDVLRL